MEYFEKVFFIDLVFENFSTVFWCKFCLGDQSNIYFYLL